jgi:hypothetical protein
VRFEVFKVVEFQVKVIWFMMLYSVVEYQWRTLTAVYFILKIEAAWSSEMRSCCWCQWWALNPAWCSEILSNHHIACLQETSKTMTKSRLLTPWCRTLFVKLIVTQPVRKYPAFFLWNLKVHHVHKSPPPQHWTLS